MSDLGHAADASTSDAVDIHFQAQPFHVVAVTFRFVFVQKLSSTLHTDIVLLVLAMPIFTDMFAATLRTLHRDFSPTSVQCYCLTLEGIKI